MRRRHLPGGFAAGAAAIAMFAMACRLDARFAARWRDAVSLPALRGLNRLTARVPFPVLEPLVVAAAGALAFALAAALARALARKRLAPLGRWLRGTLLGGAIVAASLALLWTPVRCAGTWLPDAPVDGGHLTALCGELIGALNAERSDFPDIDAVLCAAPSVARLPGSAVKAARYPEWLRACALAGLFAPPTGEAIVDARIPAPLAPFTAVHELMHLSGIAEEGAANAAAWTRCREAGGAFAASARLWALRYAMGRLAQADEAAWRRANAAMRPRLRDIYRACGGDLSPASSGSYAALVGWLANAEFEH